jgi:hypothetical protein
MIATLLATPMAKAQSRTNECETVLVFGTGMSATGVPLAGGAIDPIFQGEGTNFPTPPNAIVVSTVPGVWLTNSASSSSRWIAPLANPSTSAAGTYVYQLTFVTPCAGATLAGRFAAGDSGSVVLNGVVTGISTASIGYTNWRVISLSGLPQGTNTLQFFVTNAPIAGGPPGPTGLRAELTMVATCCPCIVLNFPTNLVVPTCAASAPVVFNVTGTNHCYTNLTIVCTPPSGSVLSAGTHTILCTATDTVGHTNNGSFTVQVGSGPPVIQQQPQGLLSMTEVGSYLLKVIATDPGGCSPRFQWLLNDVSVPGANSNSLFLSPLTQASSGFYSVIVSNFSGFVTSSIAEVRVLRASSPAGVFGRIWGGYVWYYPPAPGIVFTNQNLSNLVVQVSTDLFKWTTRPGVVALVNGVLEINDPFAVLYPKQFYRLMLGQPPAPPPAPLDPAAEVLVSSLPAATIALAQKHVLNFIGDPASRSADQHNWENISFAPTARYLYDPGYQNGGAPAYVELRILGPNGALDPRGYVILSLTVEDFPVLEFGTQGGTKTDKVLLQSAGNTVHKFMRFGPGYIVAEDGNGRRAGALGTAPLKIVDALPALSQFLTATYDSETGQNIQPPALEFNATPADSYEDLKADFQTNPARLQFRALRKQQAAARWRLSNGISNPVLQLPVGQTLDFLTGLSLASVSVEDSAASASVRVSTLAGGGFRATGAGAGSVLLRVQDQAGSVDFYSLLVSLAPIGPVKKGFCADFASSVWQAGSGWDGDQRQLRQLERDRWCPLVGCGPVALAMLLGWWDANGVPSAYYHLDSGPGNAKHFRFNFSSIHSSDAPKSIDDGNDSETVAVYDDLYGLCNVLCNPFGDEGGTYPDQMQSAFEEYTARIAAPLSPPENEFGQDFVGAHFDCGYIKPGLGLTDWEGGGKMVAHGITDGYQPGIVGLGSTLFDDHYALAYAYNRIEVYEGCGSDRHLVELSRYFQCNMGWGDGYNPEWQNAEDVWFGLTAHIWQKQLPTQTLVIPPDLFYFNPNLKSDARRPAAASDAAGNRVYLVEDQGGNFPGVFGRIRSYNGGANWFWGPSYSFEAGVFDSEPATALSIDGLKWHVFGRGLDNRFWRAFSPDGGTNWTTAWDSVGADRVFVSAPAAATSGDGNRVHVVGLSSGGHYWHAATTNAGAAWSPFWNVLGAGVFKSSPAIVSSFDGLTLRAFGVGGDDNIWWAYSTDGGATWVGWSPIGSGSFNSAPAAVCDVTGQKLRVFGRGTDNRFWQASSNDGGANWVAWDPVGDGVFSSGPSASASSNGQKIHLFGRGIPAPLPPPGIFPDPSDPRIWQNYSTDGGSTWTGWGPVIPTLESGGF